MDGATFEKVISDTYGEVVHRRKHYFSVPYDQCGKAFVCELAHLFKGYMLRVLPWNQSPTLHDEGSDCSMYPTSPAPSFKGQTL